MPEVSNTYDCNGDTGLLCQVQNAVGQITTYTYDALGHESAVSFSGAAPLASNRNYQSDPNGRITSVTSSMGTMSYAYDTDGRETMVSEPNGEAAATSICYGYYADGKRATLSLGNACPNGSSAAGGINQQNFLVYSYRADGLLQTDTLNWTTQGTFKWTYSDAGREQTETDPVTGQAVTAYYGGSANTLPSPFTETFAPKATSYDSYGRIASISYPQGYKIDAMGYDADDELAQENFSYSAGSTAVFQQKLTLNTRGELLQGDVNLISGTDGSNKGGSSQNPSQSANGTLMALTPDSSSYGVQSGAVQIDARSGMALASQNPESADGSGVPGVLADVYDPAGRQTQQENEPGLGTAPSGGIPRAYDAENHLVSGPPVASTTYTWGPDGHVRTIVEPDVYNPTSGPPTTYTLHWDGDALLFVTGALNTYAFVGSASTVDSTGLFTVIDRDSSGMQISTHGNNPTGYNGGPTFFSGWNITGASLQEWQKTLSVGSGMFYGSCGGSMNANSPQGGTCPPGWSPPVTMARPDGYQFGGFSFQGARVFDSTSAQWLTPDAYAGDVQDPMSQKPFMWNGNNPYLYADPSGYCSQDDWACYKREIESLSDPILFFFEQTLEPADADDGGDYANKTVVLWSKKMPRLGPHETTLSLPEMPGWSKATYWSRNDTELHFAMSFRRPIRDSFVQPNGKLRDPGDSFLRKERDELTKAGWSYDVNTRMWDPPGPINDNGQTTSLFFDAQTQTPL